MTTLPLPRLLLALTLLAACDGGEEKKSGLPPARPASGVPVIPGPPPKPAAAAAATGPGAPGSRRLLGDIFFRYHWYERAYRQYQDLVEMTPDDALAVIRLARAAAGTGRVDEALRILRKVAAGEGRPGADDPRRQRPPALRQRPPQPEHRQATAQVACAPNVMRRQASDARSLGRQPLRRW